MLSSSDEITYSSCSKEHINEVTHRCPNHQQGNVSIFVCVCACVYIHMCIFVCVRVHTYMHICMCVYCGHNIIIYDILTGATSDMPTVSGCSPTEGWRVS